MARATLQFGLLAAQSPIRNGRLHRRCVDGRRCKRYGVAIVGSGVAGALIDKALARRGKKVVIREAGGKIQAEHQRLHGAVLYLHLHGAGKGRTARACFRQKTARCLSKLVRSRYRQTRAVHGAVAVAGPNGRNPKKSYLVKGLERRRQAPSPALRARRGPYDHWLGHGSSILVKRTSRGRAATASSWNGRSATIDLVPGTASGTRAATWRRTLHGTRPASAFPTPQVSLYDGREYRPSLVDAGVGDGAGEAPTQKRAALGMDDPKKPIAS